MGVLDEDDLAIFKSVALTDFNSPMGHTSFWNEAITHLTIGHRPELTIGSALNRRLAYLGTVLTIRGYMNRLKVLKKANLRYINFYIAMHRNGYGSIAARNRVGS